MLQRQPVLFVSHGAPSILLESNATTRFWADIPALLPEPPRAVLCISAHWLAPVLSLGATGPAPGVQYDFYGFPQACYEADWIPHADTVTAGWLREQLAGLDIEVEDQPDHALDHGVWIPLKYAWPEPTVPIYQLSLVAGADADWHWRLGEQLAPLREAGVLIVGSGGATHNLRTVDWSAPVGQAAPGPARFIAELETALAAFDRARLTAPRTFSTGAENHPTIEHYLPLAVACGAAGGPLVPLHHDWSYGTLALHAYGHGLPTSSRNNQQAA
ncbi:MAG: class III extradiol ring-cleavage dioxygenase [Gammaproteobacteria bacterium]|jgi:4,5-DOPA dioxygenase extradiol